MIPCPLGGVASTALNEGKSSLAPEDSKTSLRPVLSNMAATSHMELFKCNLIKMKQN